MVCPGHRGSTFPVCFFSFLPFFFFCSTARLVSWRRSMVSDPKCKGGRHMRAPHFVSDTDEQGEMPRQLDPVPSRPSFFHSAASLSVQASLNFRQKSYESGQPKLMTGMIGVLCTWNELLRQVPFFVLSSMTGSEGRAPGEPAHHLPGLSSDASTTA